MVPAREPLQHEAAREEIDARAAVLLGHGDAEIALGAELGEGLRRPPFLRVHARGQRVQLPARVVAGRFEHRLLLGGQVERQRGAGSRRRRDGLGHTGVPSQGQWLED